MAINQEDFDKLSEEGQKEFTKQEDGTFEYGRFVTVKGTADGLDAKLMAQLSENNTLTEKLAGIDATNQAAIDKAKADALEAALKGNNADELRTQYEQQLADEKKRSSETQLQFEERIAKMQEGIKKSNIDALISDLAGSYATDSGSDLLKMALKQRIDFDVENNSFIFKGVDGSATSLDKSGFVNEFLQEKTLASVLKASIATENAGLSNGNTNGSAFGGDNNKKAESAKKNKDVVGLIGARLNEKLGR